jgi:hypothetical protein
MRGRFSGSMITVAIAAVAVSAAILVSVSQTSGQAPSASDTALKTPWGEPDRWQQAQLGGGVDHCRLAVIDAVDRRAVVIEGGGRPPPCAERQRSAAMMRCAIEMASAIVMRAPSTSASLQLANRLCLSQSQRDFLLCQLATFVDLDRGNDLPLHCAVALQIDSVLLLGHLSPIS